MSLVEQKLGGSEKQFFVLNFITISEQKRSFLSTGLVSDHFWVWRSDSDDDFPKLIQNLSKFIQKLSKYIQNWLHKFC